MLTRKQLIVRPLLIFLFFACTAACTLAQTKFAERKGGHSYTMNVPEYMVKTYDLNDAATLQYFNKSKEAYTIVIEDSKEHLDLLGLKFTSAEDFLVNFVSDYRKENKKRKLGQVSTTEANGNQVAQVELKWKDEDGDFFMLVSTVETKTHFYKVLCWTVAPNEGLLKDDFMQLAKSIRD